MGTVEATFAIPDWIEKGLESGDYVRFGGVIRDAKEKHVIAMLREVLPNLSQASTILSQFGSVASILNLGISVINLGISVIGFAIVIKRLEEIEQRLNQIPEAVNRIEQKIDLNFQAEFRAALNLARIAFTMDTKPENRHSKADNALEKILKAQEVYQTYANAALEEEVQVAHEYLSLLFLAYITEARCHLELEEIGTARCRLEEGSEVLRPRVEKYIRKLLISVSIGYSSPSWILADGSWGGIYLSSLVELSKLVQICQWLEPTLDWNEKNILLEAQRKNLATFIPDPKSSSYYQGSVIPALGLGIALPGVLGALGLGIGGPLGAVAGYGAGMLISKDMENPHPKVNKANPISEEVSSHCLHLLKTVEKIEEIIESYSRFEAYQAEVKSIQTLGISFHEWIELTPSTEAHQDERELMYLIPSEPIDLVIS
jgi:tetratricopeptide (TPR) repeat protein